MVNTEGRRKDQIMAVACVPFRIQYSPFSIQYSLFLPLIDPPENHHAIHSNPEHWPTR